MPLSRKALQNLPLATKIWTTTCTHRLCQLSLALQHVPNRGRRGMQQPRSAVRDGLEAECPDAGICFHGDDRLAENHVTSSQIFRPHRIRHMGLPG